MIIGCALLLNLAAHAAVITWTNIAGGNWSVGANWSPNSVPGANDIAIITNNGTYSVTLDFSPAVAGVTLGGGAGTQTLFMNGQTLTLNGPMTVNSNGSYTLDSGGLVGNSNAVLTGTFNWTAGSPGGVLTLTAGSTWNITSANDHNLPNCTFTNYGTVGWGSGRICGGGSGSLIYNYGLWNVQGDWAFTDDYGGNGAAIYNYGTFRKSAGANTSQTLLQNGVVFNQLGGMVDVQTGNLALQGGGNLDGGFFTTNQTGATVLSAGSFNINGAVTSTNTVENGGNLAANSIIRGGMTWLGGSCFNSVTIASNGVVLLAGGGNMYLYNCSVTNYGTFAWNSGYPDGGGTPGTLIYNYGLWDCQSDYSFKDDGGGNNIAFNNYGTLRKSAGANGSQTLLPYSVSLNQLGGMVDVQTGNLALQGGGNFDGGFVTTNASGSLVLSAGSFNFNGAVTSTNTVENGGNLVSNNVIIGAVTWAGGTWNGSSVTIASNSLVLLAGGGGTMYLYNCSVTNYGTFAWNSGYPDGGGTTPGTFVYNYGLWDCQGDGSFKDDGGGNDTAFNNYGTFRKSAGTNTSQTLLPFGVSFNQLTGLVDVQTGNLVLQGGGNFDGGFVTTNASGSLVLSAGSFHFNGAVTSSNTVENGGNVAANSIIRGGMTWLGGSCASSVTIASNGIVLLAGGGTMSLNNCSVTNYGTFAWNSGYPDGGGTAPGTFVYNYGLWDCQGDYTFRDDGGGNNVVFNNYGTFRKSAGADTSQTTLPAGVALNNFGTIDAEAGWLALQGGFVLTNGTLNFGISGGTNYGKLNLSGAAPLSGSVSATLNNGYLPVAGDSFTNLFYGSFTGQFANALLPFADAWITNYYPAFFVITVEDSRPVFAPLPTNTFFVNELTALTVTNSATNGDLPPQTLTYRLASGGVGSMAVSSATGILTWTPPQTNSPSTNTVSVAVTGNGTPPLSATNTFTVIVREVNVPPVLPTVVPHIVSALTLITVTNAATNANIHSAISGYTLASAPSNMLISASGVITWTPALAQSPATNQIVTIVTNSNPYDLVNPHLASTNTFTLYVGPTNVAPSLPTVVTQIVNELTLLTVTNTATNANSQATISGYHLASPPTNMVISASGIITWTPAQAQSPATNVIKTIVTNSDAFDPVHPTLTSTNTFTVIVKEVNMAPTLPVVATQIVNELTLLSVNNKATNADVHATIFGYQLVSPPANMLISTGGVITWMPAQTQSPGTNLITTIVTNSDAFDLLNPHLTCTNTFTVIVKEVNVAPTLPAVPTQSAALLQLFTVTNAATESNIHSTNAGYVLANGPPGMTINSSGVIRWTPAVSQTLTTNTVKTVATNGNPYDLVNPNLASTNSFTVVALPSPVPTNIAQFAVGGTGLDLSWPVDHTGWQLQTQTNSLAAGLGTNWVAVANSTATNHLVIQVIPTNPVVMFRLSYP